MYHRCPREYMTAHPPNLYVSLLCPLPSARGTDRRDAADGAAIYRLLLLLKTPSYVVLLYTQPDRPPLPLYPIYFLHTLLSLLI